MKKSILIAVLATLSFSTPLIWAEEAQNLDQVKKPVMAMTGKDKQMQMDKMQVKMLRMHEQMHKIMQSKDAKEREKLMQEHAKMMQNHMSMMQGMMDSDAKGEKMDGGMKGK
jgi:hypothetical protein